MAHQRILLITGIAGAGSALALLANLGSFTHGISASEAGFQARYASLSAIAHNPVQLPLLLLHWFVGLWAPLTAFWLRVPSIIVAGLTLGMVAFVLRRWYGPRTAMLSYGFFVCCAWFLHSARLGDPSIVSFWAIPALFTSMLILRNHSSSRLAIAIWVMLLASILYVPGGIWLVLVAIYLQRDELMQIVSVFTSIIGKISLAALGVLSLAPLVLGLIIGDTRVLGLTLLGLPASLPAFADLAQNFGNTLLFISFRGTADDAMWLNHLPILDIFLSIALLAGIYFYAQHWQASRARLLGITLLIALVLSSLGGPVTISLLVPVLLFIVAAGVAYLLHLWLSVFPRNPLARSFGIGLIALAIGISCFYSLRQYFVAWPRHTTTAPAFSQHKITRSHL